MTSKFQNSAAAAVAAILISTTFLAAAAGPAVAIERAPATSTAAAPTSLSVQASA